MQLHLPSLERLKESQLRGEGLVTIFEHLATIAQSFGADASTTTISWRKPEDILQPGDLIPLLTLSFHPVQETNANNV